MTNFYFKVPLSEYQKHVNLTRNELFKCISKMEFNGEVFVTIYSIHFKDPLVKEADNKHLENYINLYFDSYEDMVAYKLKYSC